MAKAHIHKGSITSRTWQVNRKVYVIPWSLCRGSTNADPSPRYKPLSLQPPLHQTLQPCSTCSSWHSVGWKGKSTVTPFRVILGILVYSWGHTGV